MKPRAWIVVIVAGFALAVAAGAGCGGKGEKSATATKAAKYYCPMHPTYVSDRHGDCPICNMKLVPVGDEKAAAEHVEAAEPSGSAGERKILFYRNPMNPDVTSPVPMKDEMGMDYVPVYSDEVSSAPGDIEGYATLTLTPEKIRLAGVQTASAERGGASRIVRTVGTVTADETRVRRVTTKISGYVEKLYVNFTGQEVRRGQPVLSIYSPELLASQEELLRAKEAAARAAVSSDPEARRRGEDLLDAARRRLALFDVPESFVSEVEAGGVPRREVTLLAPVSGYITAKETYEGAQVEPGMPLYTVTDLSRVWIEAQVYEYEAPSVRVGQQAALTLPYDPSARFEGQVSYINPYLEPESRTLTVRFEFANPGIALKPGMFVNVDLEVPGGEGVTVPSDAVLDTGIRQIVFVEQGGGVFQPRQVSVGSRSAGRAQILSGVAEGERVVVRANFLLDSESRMRAGISSASEKHDHGGAQ
jgi:RND family efflux transporter MFP subunit